ncbi:Betaine aldehyde dehydrogenase [Stieleria neptunia]|uniref:Betaine aldehyde dehydrogenase n=1 Tax=Stieleria neptunia TaxID=2527979 RepID=A0A518HXT1_9BACT|nr:aldehyde dehydrogenase family protein [Stieleria neptunia]QDV45537.1 Betaine aldehyde dehydrogenase [Stieleria neptunia]
MNLAVIELTSRAGGAGVGGKQDAYPTWRHPSNTRACSATVGVMWEQLSARKRCQIVGSVAAALCDRSDELIQACASPQRTDPVETITSELLPLCAALRFLAKRGPKILASRRVGMWRRPAWLIGVHSVVQRVPLGKVLVLGTWNYPLLLPGVQLAQALAAGNQVQLKPAAGTEQASQILVECFHACGVPADQLGLLDSDTSAAVGAIADGMDLIVLTGAAETGRKVLHGAADTLSASIMELSGCDAVIALPDVDERRLMDALRFGVSFNGSATCIAPRRLIVQRDQHDAIVDRLRETLADLSAIAVHPAARHSVADQIELALEAGAVDSTGRYCETRLRDEGTMYPLLLDQVTEDHEIASADIFAPVLSVISADGIDDAIRLVNDCPYRLAAGVFGPNSAAADVATRLNVGTVTVNDLIAPTADPRLPFGGRGQSGFGVTRGPEGLLAMTAAKVISRRRGSIAPHLRPRSESDQRILHGVLQLMHGGGIRKRLAGLRRMVGGVKKK